MQLVKPALHRLCGKGWTNNINTRHNRPSRIKPVSDNRNVGFHIAGIAVFANKNIHIISEKGLKAKILFEIYQKIPIIS